jgi:1-acyl-sn-glycerol-3-phosphate acyltransferase
VNVLRGLAGVVLMALNTLVCGSVLLLLAIVKLVIPVNPVRRRIDPRLHRLVEIWIANNTRLLGYVQWDMRGEHELSRGRWYLVTSNHQSWADIFVLQKALTGRIPLLKFFLKRELIWVPLIGVVWWALDFPFMKRHSAEFLRAHPERRGDDLAAIQKACERFSLIPTAVMNFLEGTRFSNDKQRSERATYNHLLAPKAGGIAVALDAMGKRFHSLIDVTIFYPGGTPTFFGMLAGRMRHVVVHLQERTIPGNLLGGNYAADPLFRARVQEWVTQLWREKDQLLDELHQEYANNRR